MTEPVTLDSLLNSIDEPLALLLKRYDFLVSAMSTEQLQSFDSENVLTDELAIKQMKLAIRSVIARRVREELKLR
jgi:hypothetical protein